MTLGKELQMEIKQKWEIESESRLEKGCVTSVSSEEFENFCLTPTKK